MAYGIILKIFRPMIAISKFHNSSVIFRRLLLRIAGLALSSAVSRFEKYQFQEHSLGLQNIPKKVSWLKHRICVSKLSSVAYLSKSLKGFHRFVMGVSV